MIAENYGGGPVGIETIAAALSEPRDAIEEIIEPFLIQKGFMQRTPRGRLLTGHAFRHLGLAEPSARSGAVRAVRAGGRVTIQLLPSSSHEPSAPWRDQPGSACSLPGSHELHRRCKGGRDHGRSRSRRAGRRAARPSMPCRSPNWPRAGACCNSSASRSRPRKPGRQRAISTACRTSLPRARLRHGARGPGRGNRHVGAAATPTM